MQLLKALFAFVVGVCYITGQQIDKPIILYKLFYYRRMLQSCVGALT